MTKHIIREEDLIEYAAGDLNALDDEIRGLIARERERVGSPVWKWFQDLESKARNPLKVDWLALALHAADDREHSPINGFHSKRNRTRTRAVAIGGLLVTIAASLLVVAYSRETIQDDDHTIASLFGITYRLRHYSDTDRDLIRSTLRNRSLPTSRITDEIETATGKLRTSDERLGLSGLVPDGTALRPGNVTLQWRGFRGYDSYRIVVEVIAAPVGDPGRFEYDVIDDTKLVVSELSPDRIYRWKVLGYRDDVEFVPQGFESRWAAFKILSEAEVSRIDDRIAISRDSSLVQAIVLADGGLIDEARQRLNHLVEQNEKSKVLRELLFTLGARQ